MPKNTHLILPALFSLYFMASSAFADSSTNASKASLQAVANSGAVVTLGSATIIAVPLIVSARARHMIIKDQKTRPKPSDTPIGESLPMGDTTFTAGPSPEKMMPTEGTR